jgi:Uma2 family endonuclease
MGPMSTVAPFPSSGAPLVPPRRFDNAAEWLHALGDVPLKRIIFDPPPGSATEADLLRLVEQDKRLCELIDGTLVEKSVGYWESRIATNLIIRLGAYVEATAAGAVTGGDATLRMMSSGRIRLPDVSFISTGRLPTTPKPVPVVSPDLAVEVLSEDNTTAEMNQKLREYFESGTRLAWIVDPKPRTVAVYHSPGDPTRVLSESDSLDGERVVPGFSMAVADLFRNVPKF